MVATVRIQRQLVATKIGEVVAMDDETVAPVIHLQIHLGSGLAVDNG